MANNKEAQITFKANTSQFTQAIKQMNSTMSTLDKELSLVNTQMKGSGESVELLQKKHDLLSQKLEASGTKVENLKAKLDESKRVFGENSEEAQKLGNQLLTAQNQYARLENQIGQVDDRMEQLNQQAEQEQSALGQLKNTISEQENALKQLKTQYQNVALEQGQSSDEAQDLARQIQELSSELNDNKGKLKEVADAADDLGNNFDDADEEASGLKGVFEGLKSSIDPTIASSVALGEAIADLAKSAISFAIDKIKEFIDYLWELPEATEEYRQMMAKLEGSTEQAGYKVSDAKEQYKEFYSYLNDDMAANNCVTNLQKMGLSQEQLNQVSEASIAVWTAYGDSIPIEGLTESITETTQVGKVTGNLADALNWAGINEDEFNKKLAACNSEKERAKLITDTLNGAYGEGKQKYDELTEAQRENLKSQMEIKDTEADLAEAILPIQTGFTELKNTILEALTPAIEWVSGKVQELIDWFNGLSPATQEVIKTVGMVAGVVLTVIGVLTGLAVVIGAVSFALGLLNISLLPIIAIILAVIAVIALIVLAIKNWGNICDWLSEKWDQFKEWIGGVWDSIKQKCSEVWESIKEAISNAWEGIKTTVQNAINNVKTIITTVWNAIKSVTTTIWNAIKAVLTTVWNTIKTVVQNAINNVKSKITTVWNAIKSVTSSIWNSIKTTISNIWNNIKSTIQNAVNRVKSVVQTGFNAVKNNIINPLKSAYNTVKTTFSNIYNTIRNSINNAKQAVRNALNSIRNALSSFKPSWSIPKPKLPRVSIDIAYKQIGELKVPYPKFGISWNALGGIFTKPTLFATPNAGLQGVGEAGAEAILPLDSFYNHLDNKLESVVRASAIDYDMMTNSFISALSTLTVSMSAKEVGRLTSKYSEQETNFRDVRMKRFGGATDIE